jgi:Asp-tRNA(Asn)/Glu-tRNA(Gln) amidotransferase B subunit
MSTTRRQLLLDCNYWYDMPGLPEEYLVCCEDDLTYTIDEAIKIQSVYLTKDFLFDNRFAIYKTIADIIINDVGTNEESLASAPPPEFIWELAVLLISKKISSAQGKTVFSKMIETNKSPFKLVEELNLSQSNNTDELKKWCEESIINNSKSVNEFKSGKTAAINALIGAVMKISKGKANPPKVKEILEELLK